MPVRKFLRHETVCAEIPATSRFLIPRDEPARRIFSPSSRGILQSAASLRLPPQRFFTHGGDQLVIRPSHKLRLFSSQEYSMSGPSLRRNVRSLVQDCV